MTESGDGVPEYDVLIVGGGPAGLSAALNLGRALMRVLLIDADRPRNAATLVSHGFLTRDGVSPHELRRLAREELAGYPNVEIRTRQRVFDIGPVGLRDHGAGGGFRAEEGFRAEVGRREPTESVRARAVLLATGLREQLPDVPNLRGFYGVSLFSCVACDAWDLREKRLALIGESADLVARARLISRWTSELTVFTHGSVAIGPAEEAELIAQGIAVERSPIVELAGERGVITGIRVADGGEHAIDGGFVQPQWDAELGYLREVMPDADEAGHLIVDRSGRTSRPGLYAAGDIAAPGPQQLVVAAGAGARVAAVIVHDTLGVTTTH
ncbi:NAD(P)/FAD-dependent oxidoreductase [Microbacterium sp. Mu-80]|uniref:NAD(P)/FAD-dependent oxidoreductase n=1 Tax=Microbacterium bandirmense TaxID=3122050 RepID=A0ABU8LF88_9MICO